MKINSSAAAKSAQPSPLEALLFRLVMATGGRAKRLAFTNPPRPAKLANTPRWRAAEIPSSNGHASARGPARLYTPLALEGKVGEVRLLSAANAAGAGREHLYARDVVTGTRVRRSLGFMLPDTELGDPQSSFAATDH